MMKRVVQRGRCARWNKVKKDCVENLYQLVLIFIIITEKGHCSDEVTAHCDATTLTEARISRNKLNVWKVNASSFEEPISEIQRLDICLSHGSLRLNWTMDPVQENVVKLCYDVKRIRNMNSVVTNCFMVEIPRLYYKTQLFCWFKMDITQKAPYVQALITQHTRDTVHYYYEYRIVHTDEPKNCDYDICTDPAVQLKYKVFTCGGINRIRQEDGVSVEQLSFNATNSAQCQNVILDFSKVTNRDIEFSVNCTYDGLGRIYVFYRIRENYCNPKYFVVRLSCESGTSAETTLSNTSKHSYREWTLPLVLTISSLLVTAIAVSVSVFIARRRMRDRHRSIRRPALNNRNESPELNVEMTQMLKQNKK